MAKNPLKRFRNLFDEQATLVGSITGTNGNAATVAILGGGTVRVRNPLGIASGSVFVRDGEIVGEAPAIAPVTINV